jgi:hypothetical protein
MHYVLISAAGLLEARTGISQSGDGNAVGFYRTKKITGYEIYIAL